MASCEINFGAPKEDKSTFWLDLNEMDQLDQIIEASKTKTQAIFKNSTRCGICKAEKAEIETLFKYEGKVDIYLLDLLNYRSISLAIAEKFKVEHQSPQLLIIKDGVVVHHESQHEIDIKKIEEFI